MRPRESAGGIVCNTTGRMVLVCQNGNSWSFPKGGIETGESALEAAKREIFEETGLQDLELVRELGSYERYSIGKSGLGEQKEHGLRKRNLFFFRTGQETLAPRDEEVTEARWVTIEEALALLTHPKDKAFLESVRFALQP